MKTKNAHFFCKTEIIIVNHSKTFVIEKDKTQNMKTNLDDILHRCHISIRPCVSELYDICFQGDTKRLIVWLNVHDAWRCCPFVSLDETYDCPFFYDCWNSCHEFCECPLRDQRQAIQAHIGYACCFALECKHVHIIQFFITYFLVGKNTIMFPRWRLVPSVEDDDNDDDEDDEDDGDDEFDYNYSKYVLMDGLENHSAFVRDNKPKKKGEFRPSYDEYKLFDYLVMKTHEVDLVNLFLSQFTEAVGLTANMFYGACAANNNIMINALLSRMYENNRRHLKTEYNYDDDEGIYMLVYGLSLMINESAHKHDPDLYGFKNLLNKLLQERMVYGIRRQVLSRIFLEKCFDYKYDLYAPIMIEFMQTYYEIWKHDTELWTKNGVVCDKNWKIAWKGVLRHLYESAIAKSRDVRHILQHLIQYVNPAEHEHFSLLCVYSHYNNLEYVIEHGADLSSGLSVAAGKGLSNVVELLLSKGNNVHMQNEKTSALKDCMKFKMYVINEKKKITETKHAETIACLLRHGADVNVLSVLDRVNICEYFLLENIKWVSLVVNVLDDLLLLLSLSQEQQPLDGEDRYRSYVLAEREAEQHKNVDQKNKDVHMTLCTLEDMYAWVVLRNIVLRQLRLEYHLLGPVKTSLLFEQQQQQQQEQQQQAEETND